MGLAERSLGFRVVLRRHLNASQMLEGLHGNYVIRRIRALGELKALK